MDSSFSKSLALSGTNVTTSLVLWSMIIFLVVLIGAFSFALIRQLKTRLKNPVTQSDKTSPKGF